MNSGPLVSTSEEENAVERFMPCITAAMCTVWPTSAQARKRGRSSRRGQVRASRPRNTIASSAKPSSGRAAKRMNMNAPTPSCSSTYFTNEKFTPQAAMVASAAARDQRAGDMQRAV